MLILEVTSAPSLLHCRPMPKGVGHVRWVTPPLVKNCMLRTKLQGELGLIRLRGTVSHPAFSLTKSVADSLLPPSSKIASKASVTFARSSSEITLLSDSERILIRFP
jgi:hypothetical protein